MLMGVVIMKKNDGTQNTQAHGAGSRSAGRTVSVPAELDQVLDQMIEETLATASELKRSLLQDRYMLLQEQRREYSRGFKDADSGDKAKWKRIRRGRGYQEFALTAQAMELSLKDILERAELPVKWPNQDMENMAKKLGKCSEDTKVMLARFIKQLSPLFWQPDEDECKLLMPTPTKRVIIALENKPGWKRDQRQFVKDLGDPALSKVWQDKTHATTAPLKSLLEAGDKLGFSPAWILTFLDAGCVLLADSPISEYIMAGYSFLSQENRVVFETVVDSAIHV